MSLTTLRPGHLKAHVKVTITNPDGTVAKVVEGDYEDPFTIDFDAMFYGLFTFPIQTPGGVAIHDVAGNVYYLYSPGSNIYATPYAGWCFINCPGASNAAGMYKGISPGIWLYKSPFSPSNFVFGNYANVINNITYYTPSTTPGANSVPGATYGGTASFTISQQMTNTSGSTITVTSFAVVVAVYSIYGGALYTTPILVGINYFDLSSPITWSPAAGMTVTVTYQIPN